MRANYRWYLIRGQLFILIPVLALIVAVYLLVTGVNASNESVFTVSVLIVGAFLIVVLGSGIYTHYISPRRLIKRVNKIKSLEGEQAVPELIALLSDPLPTIRTVASEKLSTSEGNVTPALVDVLTHSPNDLARAAAADTFGEKLDRAALPLLQEALEHEQSAYTRKAIMQAIQNVEKYGKPK